MGEVYRATDTKLAREIALKVLPADTASDPERLARFQREARAVAALNHPNVVTVYSVEEAENVHFITMELIEGQRLDRLISANGMPANRLIEIGGAIAEGLAAAHEKGIVHRDLKPANVMMTHEGRVKVLDFGLAEGVGAKTANDATTISSTGHTRPGAVMGTLAYMSPEQLSGRPVDHRTDIFSFGVLLHEMATGCRPFSGSSLAELVSSILRDSPPPVCDARTDLPPDLTRVVRRCLEKDPRHRVQTARDISNEFRDLAQNTAGPTPLPSPKDSAAQRAYSTKARAQEGFWVAVLPFKYTGSNADVKALAEGLSEEVITGLSRFSYLRVIARGSTVKYSSESGDVRLIARELRARYVMEGSLRQAGNRLRLAVQLVDAVSGAHLWAETYERTFAPEAIFELQDDLVPRIVATVADRNGVLPHSMSEVLRQRGGAHFTPHEAVVRSFSYIERLTMEDHAEVRKILEEAVAEAPGQSDCWAMLAIMYWNEYGFERNPLPDSLCRAHAAARRAVEASPSSALAHHALAQVLFFQKNNLGFRLEAERSMELNPMDATVMASLGSMLAYTGDWERGCAIVERACQLNPHHPGWYYYPLFNNAYRNRDYPAALQFAVKIDMPGLPGSFAARAASYGQLGELDRAKSQLSQMLALAPNFGSIVRPYFSKWYPPDVVEHYIEGLRKAGLEVPDAG
jgi:serine/threonine protein kinase/Tfp pilus assembly protein PilF